MEVSALKLVIVQGPREGESVDYPPGSKIRIGRVVRGNNLTIKDAGISSKHVSIDFESGHWVIRDLDSSNGTRVNDTALSPHVPFRISHGDSIKLGERTTIDVELGLPVDNSCLRRNPRRRAAGKEKDGGILGSEGLEGSVVDDVKKSNRVGLPRKARVLQSEEVGEVEKIVRDVKRGGETENDGKLGGRRMSTRVSRNAKNRGGVDVVSHSSLAMIPENGLTVGEEVKVEAKRTRAGGRKKKEKNVEEEQKLCSGVVDLENRGKKKVGLKDRHDFEEPTQDLGENVENECVDEKVKNVQENCEEVEKEEVLSGEGGSDKVEDQDGFLGKGNENGDGDWPDMEKMTLGEWLDFLEVYLPKQINDSTEEMIEAMRRKADQVREYIKEQKDGKSEVPVN